MKSKSHKAAGHFHEFLADTDEESVAALQAKLQDEGVDADVFLRRLDAARRGAPGEPSRLAQAAKQTKEELRNFLAKFKPEGGMPAAAFARDHATRSSRPENRPGGPAGGKPPKE